MVKHISIFACIALLASCGSIENQLSSAKERVHAPQESNSRISRDGDRTNNASNDTIPETPEEEEVEPPVVEPEAPEEVEPPVVDPETPEEEEVDNESPNTDRPTRPARDPSDAPSQSQRDFGHSQGNEGTPKGREEGRNKELPRHARD